MHPALDLIEGAPAERSFRNSAFALDQIEFDSLIGERGALAVLVAPEFQSVGSRLSRIRERLVAVPVIGIYRSSRPNTASDLSGLAMLGLDGVLDADIAMSSSELICSIGSASVESLASATRNALGSLVSPPTFALFEFGVRNANRPLTVEQASRALAVDRRTLALRSKSDHCPAPGFLLGWCRVLSAAQYLSRSGYSVRQASRELRFSTTSALRNLIKRYTGMSPLQLVNRGGVAYALQQLAEQIQVGRDREGMTRSA